MLGALLALALVLALGEGAMTLAAGRGGWPLALRLASDLVAGLVVLSAALLAASAAGVVPRPEIGLALAAALAALGAAAARRRAAAAPTARAADDAAPWSAVELAMLLLLAAFLVVPAAIACRAPVAEWDVVAIWGLKARVVASEALSRTEFFHDLSRAYAHLDYPLLWPFALAWVWGFAGLDDLIAIQLAGLTIELGIVVLLFGALRAATSRRVGLAAAVAVAAAPIVGVKSIRLLADPVVALFLLAWFAGGVRYLERRERGALALAGFAAAGLWTTKNEGLGLLALGAAGLGWALARDARPVRWRELAAGLAPLALVVPWLLVSSGLPRVHHNRGGELALSRLLAALDRLPEIVADYPLYLGALADWALFWPLALVAAAAAALGGRLRAPALRGAAFALVAPWPLFVAGFVGHELPPELLMDVAASRLALQLAPATAFLLAFALGRSDGERPRTAAAE